MTCVRQLAPLLAFLTLLRPAQAACRIEDLAHIPVEVRQGRLVVTALMNGKPARLMVDTGALATVLSMEDARRAGLDAHASASGIRLTGIGGTAPTQVATVASITFGNFRLSNQPVFVAGHDFGDGLNGLVGRDMFQDYDVDMDVPHGVIRLLRPVGCSDAEMPYWVKGSYSEAPLQVRDTYLDPFRTDIILNGRAFSAMLDTGAPLTTVTVGAAGLAGVTLTSMGSIPVGSVGGVGPGRVPSFSGIFASVGVGEEKLEGARIFVADLWKYNKVEKTGTRFGEIDDDPNYGLIGLDFMRSHHVLISNSHHKLYLTYEGGPVFLPAPSPGHAPGDGAP